MAVSASHNQRDGRSEPSGRSAPVPTIAEAEAAAEVLSRFVAGLEVERYSGDDAVTLVRLFTRVERCGVAGKSMAAHRVEQAKVHRRSGHRTAAEYLSRVTGDSVGETRDAISLGGNLGAQPDLADACRNQKLSRRRASQVSKAAKVNPKRERDLVRGAETDTDAELKERCQRASAEGRTPEEAERHRRALDARRYCRTYTDDEGALRIDALFGPESGACLVAALDAQADRQFEKARREGRHRPSAAYRADALYALITGKGILGPGDRAPGPRSTDCGSTPESGSTGTSPATPVERPADPKATVFVKVDLDALRRGAVEEGERCEIPGVGPVSVEYARGLLGSALVELLIADATDVTAVYSPGRHIPRRVLSALVDRDPRCVVPGCDARFGLENDHWVVDFAQGGLASMDNIARICHHHHQLRTHHGFRLLGGPGKWEWVGPTAPVVPKRPTRSRRSPRPVPKRRSGTQRSSRPGTGRPPFGQQE